MKGLKWNCSNWIARRELNLNVELFFGGVLMKRSEFNLKRKLNNDKTCKKWQFLHSSYLEIWNSAHSWSNEIWNLKICHLNWCTLDSFVCSKQLLHLELQIRDSAPCFEFSTVNALLFLFRGLQILFTMPEGWLANLLPTLQTLIGQPKLGGGCIPHICHFFYATAFFGL